MSDTMLLGVLRMPMDPATAGPLEIMQYVARGQEAADRIEADACEIEYLRSHQSQAGAYIALLESAVRNQLGEEALATLKQAASKAD